MIAIRILFQEHMLKSHVKALIFIQNREKEIKARSFYGLILSERSKIPSVTA